LTRPGRPGRATQRDKNEKLIEGVGGLRIRDGVGAKIHRLKHLKPHAKIILADGVRGIVGSINLALHDLTDQGLLADLEEHYADR
jgi:hypothetical protein